MLEQVQSDEYFVKVIVYSPMIIDCLIGMQDIVDLAGTVRRNQHTRSNNFNQNYQTMWCHVLPDNLILYLRDNLFIV